MYTTGTDREVGAQCGSRRRKRFKNVHECDWYGGDGGLSEAVCVGVDLKGLHIASRKRTETTYLRIYSASRVKFIVKKLLH